MPARVRGRGRGRGATNLNPRTAPAVSNTPRPRKSKSAHHLPPQYEFTPANSLPTNISQRSPVPFFQPLTNHGVQNFPPPITLFPNARSHSGASPTSGTRHSPLRRLTHRRFTLDPLLRFNLESLHRILDTLLLTVRKHKTKTSTKNMKMMKLTKKKTPKTVMSSESIHRSASGTNTPTRRARCYTTLLSPHLEPGTTWFGQRNSGLTRKITKIFTNKFNEPYYSWSCVPIPKREKYFLEFAKEHTWIPLYTGGVQAKFEKICQTRMKDMVSKAGSRQKQPNWINDTLWKVMCAHWDTEESKEKSQPLEQLDYLSVMVTVLTREECNHLMYVCNSLDHGV